MRVLDFDDGFSSESQPAVGTIAATALSVFASDAAFVASKGSAAANGDSYYNSADNVARIYRGGSWQYSDQPAVTGTRAAAQNITAGGGIAFVGKRQKNTWYVQGSGGPVTVTANPRIAVGAWVGQQLTLTGCDDAKKLTLQNGNGLLLNGDIVLGADSDIDLEWDGTNWREEDRNDV